MPSDTLHFVKETVLCFSHLRWNFVYQRPQHLLTRYQNVARVLFVEEPIHTDELEPRLSSALQEGGVEVLTPFLPHGTHGVQAIDAQRTLLDNYLVTQATGHLVAWYYTPMALLFSRHLSPDVLVYDCMDELSGFDGAPPELVALEEEIFERADVVFVGGQSLFEAKKKQHDNAHLFASSIDAQHFTKARIAQPDPDDQQDIPHPRIGFYGVLDERLDRELLAEAARLRPDLHFILIGPVVKIREEDLPRGANLHYLGQKSYRELPAYLAGWDAAMLPFARNASTRFISPTKTPEYLAAGKPTISTPIHDVVRPYGEMELVRIGANAEEFCVAIDESLVGTGSVWLAKVDSFLANMSWDKTFAGMRKHILRVLPEAGRPTGTMGRENGGAEPMFDYVIIGAGFAGSVLAERLATEMGARVLIVDRRNHIAGNAYDYYNEAGILVHKYGPHIFHTNSEKVFAYLSRFTTWRPYEHRVQASVDGQLLPMPINADTLNKMYGLNLNCLQVKEFLQSVAEPRENIQTSEDVVVSRVGRELYEKFFRNYTRKQWALDPSELDAAVTARVPVRTSRDDRYFTDRFQAMPAEGYTRMFEKMLDHPNIHIMLNTDYSDIKDEISFRELIFTGPVDEYFNFCHGKLPYRSLQFEHQTHDREQFQPAAVVNYPNEHAYTRVTEFKYLTGQEHKKTSIVYEYPCAEGDPYYPIPQPKNAELYTKYKAMAEALPDVHFAGRLATYKYYNMDQVVAQSLTLFQKLSGRRPAQSAKTALVAVPSTAIDAARIEKSLEQEGSAA